MMETMGALTEGAAMATGASAGTGCGIADRLAQKGVTALVGYGKSTAKARAIKVLLAKRSGGRHS